MFISYGCYGLIGFVKSGIYVGAGLALIFKLNTKWSVIAAILAMFAFYVVGYIDLKYFGLMQKEQELMTSKYNPHLNKIGKFKKSKSL